jgi:hypothetical protein
VHTETWRVHSGELTAPGATIDPAQIDTITDCCLVAFCTWILTTSTAVGISLQWQGLRLCYRSRRLSAARITQRWQRRCRKHKKQANGAATVQAPH